MDAEVGAKGSSSGRTFSAAGGSVSAQASTRRRELASFVVWQSGSFRRRKSRLRHGAGSFGLDWIAKEGAAVGDVVGRSRNALAGAEPE